MLRTGLLVGTVSMFALLSSAHAVPITYNFTGPTAGANTDLGATEVYTASGGPNLTATAGVASGSAPSSAIVVFSISSGLNAYHLVGNNRGADEQGVGVCISFLGFTCSGSSLNGEIGEIDRDSNEVVQLNVSPLYASYTSFTINADSATDGEVLGIYQSNSATSIGTLVTTITSASGDLLFTPTMDYLYFVSSGPNGGGGENVLLHSLTVTPDVDINPLGQVPEPASIAALGSGLVSLAGVLGWRRRRQDT